jgi:hypothetical protein
MNNLRAVALVATLAVASLTWTHLDGQTPDKLPPDVSGDWTGAWWDHPPMPLAPKPTAKECKQRLDCTVVQEDKLWQATFEGECGRPYKFTIKMDGRQSGPAVLFKGTTDLGEANGGVFDWIGRATEREFVGFFTSAKHAGEFRMERKK